VAGREKDTWLMTVRILIVDDNQLMREGLVMLLKHEPDLEVVGEASDGRTALELVKSLEPHVVVMDVGLPELNGVEATQQIMTENPDVRVVALSAFADRRYVTKMLEAGASGYVLKLLAHDDLPRAVRAASAGETFLSPGILSPAAPA
jgi:two-component system, NarL family, response regulator NreC